MQSLHAAEMQLIHFILCSLTRSWNLQLRLIFNISNITRTEKTTSKHCDTDFSLIQTGLLSSYCSNWGWTWWLCRSLTVFSVHTFPRILCSFSQSKTFCLLWSYLCATLEPKALWSWISTYNPSQKLNGLWHPAGLCSPTNLCPQFPELELDVWRSLNASPSRPVDIEFFFASIFSTCDHISLLKIDLFEPPFVLEPSL